MFSFLKDQNESNYHCSSSLIVLCLQVVASNEELRVWYAEDYAEFCGMRVLERVDKDRPPSPPSPFTEQLLAIGIHWLMFKVHSNLKKYLLLKILKMIKIFFQYTA